MANIYTNNDVKILSEKQDEYETKINVNGQNLIWISNDDLDNFKHDLTVVLNKYRI